jgi:hypothetical protein
MNRPCRNFQIARIMVLGLALVGLSVPASPAAQLDSHSNPVPAGSIVIDGAVADWAGVPCFTSDPAGDGGAGYDIARYCIAHDDNNFYVRVGLHGEGAGVLGDGAGMWTWFDTDKNSGTGIRGPFLTSGLGAEWNGSGVSQFNGWNSAGGHTGSILGSTVAGARSGDHLEYEYSVPRSTFGVDSFHTSVQSEFGAGDVLPDGAGNFFEYHAPPVMPPPLPPISYVYESNSAVAHAPPGGGVLGDPGRTKLIDGAASNTNWLNPPDQWVGSQDPAFVPDNLAGDTELPQPRVEFTFDSPRPLASVTITYMVENDAKIYAPDYVVASFSSGGGAFGGDVVGSDFDNTPDGFPNPPTVAEGAIRMLTLDLGGVVADKVRLDFFNDFEWTAIGEVSFTAVPEPSTYAFALLAAAASSVASWRRRAKGSARK